MEYTGQFNRDVKRLKKQGLPLYELKDIIKLLASGEKLPLKTDNHKLHGEYKRYWECHISPDWLLIYWIDLKTKTIVFIRTGSHAELFKD